MPYFANDRDRITSRIIERWHQAIMELPADAVPADLARDVHWLVAWIIEHHPQLDPKPIQSLYQAMRDDPGAAGWYDDASKLSRLREDAADLVSIINGAIVKRSRQVDPKNQFFTIQQLADRLRGLAVRNADMADCRRRAGGIIGDALLTGALDALPDLKRRVDASPPNLFYPQGKDGEAVITAIEGWLQERNSSKAPEDPAGWLAWLAGVLTAERKPADDIQSHVEGLPLPETRKAKMIAVAMYLRNNQKATPREVQKATGVAKSTVDRWQKAYPTWFPQNPRSKDAVGDQVNRIKRRGTADYRELHANEE